MTREHVSLTIYNQGSSLVRERRRVELSAGENTLDITDVASQIDATSVTLQADGVNVLEQNYLYDLVGGRALLQRYIEETIEITTEDGAMFRGQLLSTEENNNKSDVILSLENGQILYTDLNKIRDIRFPALPGGLMTRPTLRWSLHSEDTDQKEMELTYLARGLSWTSDYNLLLARDNTAFDISGWVTLTNKSGATFDNAQVKLIAGDVHRLPQRQNEIEDHGVMRSVAASSLPQVEQREVFEYHLYEIKRFISVTHNETKQVEFVSGKQIPCEVIYLYDSVSTWFVGYHTVLNEQHLANESTQIKASLRFSTGTIHGLGKDLPAGRLRVYQEDTDGAAVMIGENRIDHTPQGETVEFELGAAFDLIGERKQTDFQKQRKNVIIESYEIKLRNRKDTETVEISVRETLFRWNDWTIIEHSDDFTKVDSSHIEFRVSVAPGEERVITYTVRYKW